MITIDPPLTINNALVPTNEYISPNKPREITLEVYNRTALKLKALPNRSTGTKVWIKYTLASPTIGMAIATINTPIK